RSPFLAQLAGGSPDALLDLILAQPQLAGERAGAWSLLTLAIAFGAGLLYNLFCGGILSAYGGRRTFWAGCAHFVLPFMVLGLLVSLLAGLAIGIGIVVGMTLSPLAGVATGLALTQVVNLWGEYGRGAAIARNRRNPFAMLAIGAGVIARRPGSLLLGALGFALSSAITFAMLAALGPAGGSLLGAVLLQILVLALILVKQLRLAWALAYCQQDAPGETQARESESGGPIDVVRI
ncbi:MAG TPA: hypothetical protein VFT99_16705, partial [Roseiflexaceae bacterium]|nr:hypothetical protein [Roseiflexaceae bacterium]